VTLDYKTW